MSDAPPSVSSPGAAPVIVGVGASAGGLDAFRELLKHIGPSEEIVLVFVQHHDPANEPLLRKLLAEESQLEVIEITGRKKLKTGCVYISHARQFLQLNNGVVTPIMPGADESPLTAIDRFFHSLAEDQGQRAVGIVLSGAGSDGTVGIKAISDAGGLTFAQDLASASFDSMPRSAATTGVADHVCRPSEIAAELLRYASHVLEFSDENAVERIQKQIGEAIPRIAQHLLKNTGHNFQHYKITTLTRRIQRRMQILKIATANEYFLWLQQHEDETNALFRELLIGVTAFFRDPEAFDAIAKTVLPKIFSNRNSSDPIRIWVAGCSTGEEAYSLAMLCREQADAMESPPEFQIFATDIDERALQIARAGTYPTGIADYVSPERLKRFFVKRGKRYHITSEIRERVLFSKHNLISDPPFSRQDLISCRNLLIYLGTHLQEKLIPLFHYAIQPSGFLFLGPSETISTHGELFKALDSKFRISQRKGTATDSISALAIRQGEVKPIRVGENQPDSTVDLDCLRQRILLDEFAPKAVVIDQSGQVLNASDGIAKYLAVSGGDFQNNIIKMAVSGLRIGLRAAINEATRTRRKVTHENLSIRDDDMIQRVMLTVQPMPKLGEDDELLMVVFHDVGEPIRREDADTSLQETTTGSQDADAIIAQMERELEATRSDLERTLQDMEAANEEMKSSNEELLSMNEELQSANEELETSKEEIRSASDAIARANTDLENLLRSTQIATVFLDSDLNIRSFTPAITEIYGLLGTDAGRSLEQFVPLVDQMPPLPKPETLHEGEVVEHTVRAKSGKYFIRRVLPYQSHLATRDGVVVTFINVSDIVEREARLASLMSSAAEGIYGIDHDGNCTFANQACARLLGYESPSELLGKQMHGLIHHTHRDGTNYPFEDCKIARAFKNGQQVHSDQEIYWRADGTSFDVEYWSHPQIHDGSTVGCVVTFIDITERRKAEIELADAKARLELSLEVADVAPWNWDMQTGEPISNPILNRLFGFEEHESPPLKEFINRIDESVREDISNAIENAIATGETYDQEYPVRWPSGEVRHLRARGRVRMSNEGVTQDFFGVVLDITERKRRELHLADRESHLRRVIDHQIGLVGVLEPDGTLVEANATAVDAAGLQRSDVIGKKFWDCYWWNYDAKVAARLKDKFEQALAGEIVRYDEYVRMADDETMAIDFMISPVRDTDGTITHLIPSAMDISDRKKAEEEVAQREQRLQLALDSGGMGLWEWDCGTDLITWSDQMYAMFGYSRDEFDASKAGFLDVVYPDDRPMLEKMIKSAFAGTCQTHEVEFRVVRGTDKSIVWTQSRGTIHRDADGNPLSIVSVAVDVTRRKRWEMELVDREAHLRRVINNQLGLVGVIDRNGILLEVDDRSLEIARTRREEVIGKHFAEAPWWNYDPAVAQQMREAMQRALKGEVVRYDVSLFAHGNSGVMIDFMIAPVFDADGNVEYLIPSGVDIRERVKIEQEQRSVTRRMKMALRAGGMAAWEWTPKKSIWTPELYELLGIDPQQESSSELFFSLVHPEDLDLLKQDWERAVNGGDAYDSEFRIIRPDGEVRWMNGLGEVVRDGNGKVIRMHGVNWDSTQDHLHAEALRESERRAHEASASKSEFLANMSHEIRTPMTAILGYAELIRDLVDDEEARQHLQTIRRNGDYLLEIINDILDLSKIEAGKVDVDIERFEPARVIEDVRSIMEVRASESGLELDVEYESKIPKYIESDAKRLKQILINLVGNAIKFTRKGEVRIRVRFDGSRLKFDVTDTGIGMTPEQQQRLFKPFSQGDSLITQQFGGTGLGLAISQRLASMLGGEISVSSTFEKGSTFTVAISTGNLDGVPLVKPLDVVEPEFNAGEIKDIQISAHILIVDDRRDIRFLSKHIINKAGGTVTEAEDGVLAIQSVKKANEQGQEFNLILLDMQMPNMDGYETARRLRQLGYAGPIIALTADAMQGDMNKCLEAGCNDYLSKPIDKVAMLRKISEMLG
ncbi:PAS domain S-box protein [Rubripirellula amarantea]|uniref:PAS domain S-box protein n=1 Tax=Rubripirellula amarantea TaxID=2527999 RepID=UPI0013EEF91E|nr:PAS domain S-box protein [Rubripirellula amarantea]